MLGLSWWLIANAALVLGALSILMVVRRRSRARGGDNLNPTTLLRVTRFIAIMYAVASAVGMVVGVIQTVLSETVTVRLPVAEFWPSLPSTVEITGTTADVVGGGFDHAIVAATGLDTAPRVWLAASDVLQGVTAVVIAMVVVVLCTSVIRQNPFRPTLTRGINLTATTILVGGLGWQICDTVAGALASSQVLRPTGWGMNPSQVDWTDVREVIGLPEAGLQITIDFWPIWVALALFAVSAAFQYGQKLQRDTAGLV